MASSNGDDAWVFVVPCRPAVVGARSRMAARPDVNESTASVVRTQGLAATSLPSYAVSSPPRTPIRLGESLLPAVKHGGPRLVRVVAGGGVETARGHVASTRIANRARAQSSAWIPGVVSLVHSNGLSISLTVPVAGGRVERNTDHGNVKACVRLQPTVGVGKMTESRDPGKRPLLQHQPSDGCGEIQERRTSKSKPIPAGAAPEVARAPT